MTSFGWKKKRAKLSKEKFRTFEEESKEDTLDESEIDWLTLAPKRKGFSLEDRLVKTNRLKTEGCTLAEAGRYWEAVGKFDSALSLTPLDGCLMEMKAQAYMELCEVFPAVSAAKKAVELAPTWYIAYQTLGRAHLGLGEVKLAQLAFSKALHLNPDDATILEDLNWSVELLKKKSQLSKDLNRENNSEVTTAAQVTELNPIRGDSPLLLSSGEPGSLQRYISSEQTTADESDGAVGRNTGSSTSGADVNADGMVGKEACGSVLKSIPRGYVLMRDER